MENSHGFRTNMPDDRRVFVIGCGYLGMRAARRWIQAGYAVSAMTRSRKGEFQAQGINPVVADVMDPSSLRELPEASTLLYAVGMDRTTGHSMSDVYVRGLQNVLTNSRSFQRIIYISSTSVYGQTDGSWVDEQSPTEPVEESGKVVLAAENMLRLHRPDAIILRFAGIYGPGRLMRAQSLLRGEPVGVEPQKLLNLIHVDDGAEAVIAAGLYAKPGSTFTIADDCPVSRGDFYRELGRLLKAPEVKFDPSLSAGERHGQTNRRISNQSAKSQLQFQPRFPSYREGLPTCL